MAWASLLEGEACIVGYGRVGSVTAELLRETSTVLVLDNNRNAIAKAARDGFDAYLVDTTSPTALKTIVPKCTVFATALPSTVAPRVVEALVHAGAKTIVDVSYVEDPWIYVGFASGRGVRIVVDAGIAPGFSNMAAAYLTASLGADLSRLIVYVGGVSERPGSSVLGLVASWNIADLLEEYSRPARARINGKLTKLDPVDDATLVSLPGLGVFDAMPTDGLRTMLNTIPARTMIEYTLRYPGHVAVIRLFKSLGLLDEKPRVVEGEPCSPRKLLARLLEEVLPSSGDRVVLFIEAKSSSEEKTISIDVSQRLLSMKRPALTLLTSLVHAWFTEKGLNGDLEKYGEGVIPPERPVLEDPGVFREVLLWFARHGVSYVVEGEASH